MIVPVKGHDPKARLGPLLTQRQRGQLQIAMLEDTLQTLSKAKMIGHAFVVSSNLEVLEFVRRFGARTIHEPDDAGVNAAVNRGLEETAEYERQLIIPADLPLLAVDEPEGRPHARKGGRAGSDLSIGGLRWDEHAALHPGRQPPAPLRR